ncbi:hypothetical protein [Aliiglaciecola litoralis]|uniref:Uncharacterized protein n=1 Tax=Aliiglaciecola litoralis TaxID=582857 RepID=A0ABN1LFL5_9ALTE
MKNIILTSAMMLALFTSFSQAQQSPNFLYDSLSDKLSDQLKATLKVMNDPEIVAANAAYIKSLYDALIKQGFTKEEALTLVSASLSAQKNH